MVKRIRMGTLALCLTTALCMVMTLLALALAVPAYACASASGAGGESIIEIQIYNKQPTLTIQVVDKTSGKGIPSVRVELRDPKHPDAPPITGSPLGVHETDGDGRIEVKLFSDPDRKYQIWVNHLDYDPYVGDIFTVQKDTYKLVELVKSGTSGGGSGGGSGDSGSYVYYYSGTGGSLDGVKRERVPYNGSPKEVPTVIPDEGYDFSGWMLGGRFVEPGDLKVQKTISLYAVFERQPAPVPPSPAQPLVPPSVQPPVPPSAQPPVSPPVQPPLGPPSAPSLPDGLSASSPGHASGLSGSAASGMTGKGQAGGTADGGVPKLNESDSEPGVPALGPSLAGQDGESGRDNVHWWILLCAALTVLLGSLRLRSVHRSVKGQGHETRVRKDRKGAGIKHIKKGKKD